MTWPLSNQTSWVRSGYPSSGIGGHRAGSSSSGIHDVAMSRGATKITDRLWDLQILLSTAGSIFNGGKAYTIPIPYHGTDMASTYLILWSGNGDAKTGSFLLAKSRTDRSLVFPMHRTLEVEAACWLHTLSVVPHETERQLECCAILEGELAPAGCPSHCKTWEDESSGGSVWTIWSRLPCWCTTGPRHCYTWGTLPETWVEAETRLHSRLLPPSLTDWCVGSPAAGTTSPAVYGNLAAPPIRGWRHLWTE